MTISRADNERPERRCVARFTNGFERHRQNVQQSGTIRKTPLKCGTSKGQSASAFAEAHGADFTRENDDFRKGSAEMCFGIVAIMGLHKISGGSLVER